MWDGMTDAQYADLVRETVATLNSLIAGCKRRELVVHLQQHPADQFNPVLIVNILTEVA